MKISSWKVSIYTLSQRTLAELSLIRLSTFATALAWGWDIPTMYNDHLLFYLGPPYWCNKVFHLLYSYHWAIIKCYLYILYVASIPFLWLSWRLIISCHITYVSEGTPKVLSSHAWPHTRYTQLIRTPFWDIIHIYYVCTSMSTFSTELSVQVQAAHTSPRTDVRATKSYILMYIRTLSTLSWLLIISSQSSPVQFLS